MVILNMSHISRTFEQPVQFLFFNIAWTFIVSLVTGNVSQVDRVWTFLPTLYTAYFTFYPLLDWADPAIKSGGVRPRVVLMLVLQVCVDNALHFHSPLNKMVDALDDAPELQHVAAWSL